MEELVDAMAGITSDDAVAFGLDDGLDDISNLTVSTQKGEREKRNK